MKYKSCLLLDTSSMGGFALENIRRLRDAARNLCDVFIAVHPKSDRRHDGFRVLNYDDDDVLHCVRHSKDISKGVIPGNFDLKIIRMAQDLPQYSSFLRIEYDVVATRPDVRGSLDQLLAFCERFDFVSSFFAGRGESDPWMWWPSLNLPASMATRVSPKRCFCPIMFYNRRFIAAYESALADGLRGHAEATLATVAYHHGMRVGDLASPDARFTSFPQFTFDRPRNLDSFVPHFIHPVKTQDVHDQLLREMKRSDLAAARPPADFS